MRSRKQRNGQFLSVSESTVGIAWIATSYRVGVGEGTLVREMQQFADRISDWTQHIPSSLAATYYDSPPARDFYEPHLNGCGYWQQLLESLHATDIQVSEFTGRCGSRACVQAAATPFPTDPGSRRRRSSDYRSGLPLCRATTPIRRLASGPTQPRRRTPLSPTSRQSDISQHVKLFSGEPVVT